MLPLLAALFVGGPGPVYKDHAAPLEKRVEDLLRRMTLEEKLNQLRCDPQAWQKAIETTGYGETLDLLRPLGSREAAERANAIQRQAQKNRLGIPITIHDEALHGLIAKGTTSFPQSIGMAATWDPAMVGKVASAIAEESRARGVRHVLSPVINVVRDARWGRVEETYGEDPLLTSRMGVAYVKAFETRGVATTPKHYVANVGDGGRDSHGIEISERQLREVYLPPFEAVVKEGGASTLMSSYNSVNGRAVSANSWLLTDILRGEWGFDGWVGSDYGAVQNVRYAQRHAADDPTTAALCLNAGLGSEWPNASIWGAGLDEAVKRGLVKPKTIDEAVRRVLRVKFRTGMFDNPWADPEHVESIVQSPAHREIALAAARESTTLLKNENKALPLRRDLHSIAVIGPVGGPLLPLGGYSPTDISTVSILDGIRAKAPGARVEWARGGGFDKERILPTIGPSAFRNLKGEYWDNDSLNGAPKLTRADTQIAFDWGQGEPAAGLPRDHFSARWTGQVVPDKTGDYTLALRADDGVRLWVDGRLLIDDWAVHPPKTSEATIHAEADRPLDIKVEYFEAEGEASVSLGWGLAASQNPELDEAVALAKRSEVAVVAVGIREGEGQDRSSLDLPGDQEELIRRVAATGTPTVVVLVAGAPVTMDGWIDRVPAVLDAWYPGQEGGTAVAEALFGDVNPGGKLPITFPRTVGQCPVYYALEPSGRGYDYVDLTGRPRFPFGYGLSYTTFGYDNLRVSPAQPGPKDDVTVSFDVTNTGAVAGDEVPQLYLHQAVASIVRPLKELKGFSRIHLAAGERRTVSFLLTPKDRSLLDAQMKRVIEPGAFEVMVGASSDDVRLRGSFDQR